MNPFPVNPCWDLDLPPVWPAANVVREPAELPALAAMDRTDDDYWSAEALAAAMGGLG